MKRPHISNRSYDAFTVIELLIVIALIAIIVGLVPFKSNTAIEKAQMTKSMMNMRQLYIATASTENAELPGEVTNATVNSYINGLFDKKLLNDTDLNLFSAPGFQTITNKSDINASTIAFHIGAISKTNENRTIFLLTKNHRGNLDKKDLSGPPFYNKGFVVLWKDGSATIFNSNQSDKTNIIGSFPSHWLP